MLRTDEATRFFGIRLNVFTSIVVFLGALAYFLVVKGPREYVVPIDAPETEPEPAAEGGVSAVDVGGDQTPRARGPKAYQVVGEDRFLAYQRTGILPPEPEGNDAEPAEPAGSSVRSADEA
jgi:hypothetical protein